MNTEVLVSWLFQFIHVVAAVDSVSDAVAATEHPCIDDEPFIPPSCMPVDGQVSVEISARDDADVADEEIVVSTSEIPADSDELTADKTAEKMIERRIQV